MNDFKLCGHWFTEDVRKCQEPKELLPNNIYSSVNIVYGLGLRKKTRKKKCDATAGLHDLSLWDYKNDMVQILFVSMCHQMSTSAYAGTQLDQMLFRIFDPSREIVDVP